MTNLWLINGIDIWLTYGVYILKSNYNDLLTPANPRKRLEHEYTDMDGISVDTISALTYEARRFNIKIGMRATSNTEFWSRYNTFFALLSQAGSFDLYISDLDKTYTLIYEGVARTEKLTPIATANGQVVATFEIKLLEPLQATNTATIPDLIVINDGVVEMVNNSTEVFEIIDGKVYLNI